MPLRPDTFDYESVFPARKQPARDTESVVRGSRVAQPTFEEVSSHSSPLSGAEKGSSEDGLFSRGNYWIRRRGHAVSFFLLFVFSIVLYLRPYELVPALASFTSMAFYAGMVMLIVYAATQLSTDGNLTARPREVNLVLLLGVAALLSMPMAIDPAEAWQTFSELLLKTILVFIVIVNVVRTELRLNLLLLLVLGVSVYLSVNAISDYQQGVFQVGALETHDARITGSIKGLFENSNDLAMHLVTMIPIAVALGLMRASLIRKVIFFGVAGLMVGAVIVTFSRGGFLGLTAAVLMMVRRLGRKNRTATAAALVLGALLFFALAPGAYSSRLSTIFDSSADLTESSTQRTQVLKRSVWVSLRYPLFGVGIGNFHHKSIRELVTHNSYTQVSSEMGIAAMVIYIMFLIHPLRRLRLIENQSQPEPDQRSFYYLAIGLQASLVGFMVSSFFGSVAYYWYVYYLVGYAVCLHRMYLMKSLGVSFPRNVWERPFARIKGDLVNGSGVSQSVQAQERK